MKNDLTNNGYINQKEYPHGWLKNGNQPCDIRLLPKCQAKAKSTGERCKNIAMRGKRVCYIHGGKSKGPPKGSQNALKHGYYTQDAIEERRDAKLLIGIMKHLGDMIEEL